MQNSEKIKFLEDLEKKWRNRENFQDKNKRDYLLSTIESFILKNFHSSHRELYMNKLSAAKSIFSHIPSTLVDGANKIITLLNLMIESFQDAETRENEKVNKLREIYTMYEGEELGASTIQRMLNFKFPPEGTADIVDLIYKARLSDRTRIIREGNKTKVRILKSKLEVEVNMESSMNNRIFIVHGRDELMLEKVKNTIIQLKLEPIILREKPHGGTRALIEKFKKFLTVRTAIVLLSPDDKCYGKGSINIKTRARQNVLFELGFFCGSLGMDKVITILRKDKNFEFPSDILGTTYIDFCLDNWPYKLADELKVIFEGSGIGIDKNLL